MSSISRRKYSVTRGADFSNDESMVDYERAPICENIIPDGAGYPEKRPGWRKLSEYENKIYGLHKYTFGGVTKMLVHEGTKLWIDGATEPLCEDMAENISRSYQNEDDLIILDGQNYRVYSEKNLEKLGIPFITPQPEGAVLSYNGCIDVIAVYQQFTGNEKKTWQTYEEMSGATEILKPADKTVFKMETAGWYTWVIKYTDPDGNEAQKGFTFHSSVNEEVTDKSLYMYKEEGTNNAVLYIDGTEYLLAETMKWGYVGEEDKEYKKVSEALADCTDIRTVKSDIMNGYKIHMPKKGFYRFLVRATQNVYPYSQLWHIFTLYANDYENGFMLSKLGKDDTINRIKSEGKHTDGGAYIPTTSISNGARVYNSSGTLPTVMNGVGYEKVNKLSPWRRMTAVGYTETSTDNRTQQIIVLDDNYCGKLVGNEIKYTSDALISGGDYYFKFTKAAVYVNGVKYDVVAAFDPETNEFINSDAGECKYLNTHYGISCIFLNKNVIHLCGINATPPVVGRDNIQIYYEAEADEDNDIAKCTVISEYDNSIFVTGNPDKPNFDWHSYVENPYYFPDLNYQKFGDNTAVLGYINTGEYQAIVKADGAAGGSIYIRSIAEFNGERAYPVKQMASGVGGVSKDGFCSLIGDDLMLTQHGIFAFTTIDMTGEKTLSNRSWYVDGKLTKENLSNANMFVWQGKCFCAVEDRVYILNAEASMSRNYKNNVLYDCYFWTGIPIERVLVVNDELYFSNGSKLCKLNTDVEGMEKYNDDGAAIVARWGTKLDDDEDITRYKTMIKRGNTVTVKPFTRSSATVYLRTEKDNGKKVKEGIADIFDWENIDFSRISFDGTDTLREIIVNTKVKKYKRLQFVVENAVVNEGFGITEINKHYVYGNFIKR